MSLAQSLANIIQNEAFQRGQLGIQAAGIIPNAIAQGADTLQGALNQMSLNKTRGLQQEQLKRAGELQELQLNKAKRDEQNDAEIRAILKAIPDGPNATQQRAQAFVQFWQTRDPEKAMAMRNSLRSEAIQGATLMEGKPGRTPVQAGVEAQLPATTTSPVVPLESQQVAHEPVTIPGVYGPDIQVQPSTQAEIAQRALAAKRAEAQIKHEENIYTIPGIGSLPTQAIGPAVTAALRQPNTAGTGRVRDFDKGDGKGVRSYQFNPKTGLYDIDLGKPKPPVIPFAATNLTASQKAQQQFQLRKEFNSSPIVKEYDSMRKQMARVESAMEQAKTSKNFVAIDQALINGLNKMIDPNSVVREGEYARTIQNSPLLNRAVGKIAQISQGGGGFTPEERTALVSLMRDFNRDAEELYSTHASEYERLAEEMNIPKDRIVLKREKVTPKGAGGGGKGSAAPKSDPLGLFK